jgi:transcriptional regulator
MQKRKAWRAPESDFQKGRFHSKVGRKQDARTGQAKAMYQPPHFREDRIEVQHALIRDYPLGLLVTAGPSGLMANPVPFLIDAEGSELGVLRCHLARANPQWRELAALEECMAVFQGPEAYVTPSWYATKRESGRVVPTWNYATVHIWGRPRVVEEPEWLYAQIDALTQLQEGRRTSPWSVSDAPADYLNAQMRGIVGVELPISRIEGKWKVSQNRPAHDRAGVVEGLLGEERAARMAGLVAERSASAKRDA